MDQGLPRPHGAPAGGTFAVMKALWDISPAVHAGSPVFPEDTPFQQHWDATIGPASMVNLSTLTFSPHIGAHADAPLHYDPHGAAIGALALEPFLGPCRVVHAIDPGPLVEWPHIAHAIDARLPARVLVRTRRHAAVAHWDAQLTGYAPSTLERLADHGVLLVGIDSASVDPADSRQLPSHQVLRRRQLRVLENLVLDAVPEGDYELIALPLRLSTADASPVRAILRTL